MYNSSEVAERINFLLKKKSVSQKKMLIDCGLNKNAISSMISRGSMPQAENLAKIADYLDVSVDYLLGRTDAQKEKPLSYSDLTESEKIRANRLLELTDDELQRVWDYVDFILSQRDK